MPYWMTNPVHGVMPVYSQGEVEQAKVHGWSLLNEGDSPVRADRACLDESLGTVEVFIAASGAVYSDQIEGARPMGAAPIPLKRKPGRPAKAK